MSSENLDRFNRQRRRNLPSAYVPFQEEEVINNPYAIRKLNEERELLFAEKEDLSDELEEKTSELIKLRLENQRLDEVKRRSWPIFLTLTVSKLLFAIGVNIFTGGSDELLGGGLVFLSIVLDIVIFLLLPK